MFQYFFAGGFALGAGKQRTVCMIRSNLAFSIMWHPPPGVLVCCYKHRRQQSLFRYSYADWYYAVGDDRGRVTLVFDQANL